MTARTCIGTDSQAKRDMNIQVEIDVHEGRFWHGNDQTGDQRGSGGARKGRASLAAHRRPGAHRGLPGQLCSLKPYKRRGVCS